MLPTQRNTHESVYHVTLQHLDTHNTTLINTYLTTSPCRTVRGMTTDQAFTVHFSLQPATVTYTLHTHTHGSSNTRSKNHDSLLHATPAQHRSLWSCFGPHVNTDRQMAMVAVTYSGAKIMHHLFYFYFLFILMLIYI